MTLTFLGLNVTQSIAATSWINNDVVGAEMGALSYRCIDGKTSTVTIRHDFKLSFAGSELKAPKVADARLVGTSTPATCLAWGYKWATKNSLPKPVVNTVPCTADLLSAYPWSGYSAAQFKKIKDKPLCKTIESRATLMLVRHILIDVSAGVSTIQIGVKSGDQVQESRAVSLKTLVTPFGQVSNVVK